MVKFLFVTCILATWAAWPAQSLSNTPATSKCSTLTYKLTDCVPYLTKGASQTTPDRSCCSGYTTVIKIDDECICEAIKSNVDSGLRIDISKAMKLPSACGDKSTHLSSCFATGGPPSHAPSKPPTPATPPPPQVPAPSKAAANTKMPTFTLLSFAIVSIFYFVAWYS